MHACCLPLRVVCPVQVGQKQGAAAGLALGGMQLVMFCSYAIALYYGAVRVSQVWACWCRAFVLVQSCCARCCCCTVLSADCHHAAPTNVSEAVGVSGGDGAVPVLAFLCRAT